MELQDILIRIEINIRFLDSIIKLAVFNDKDISNFLIVYMRIMTSGYLKMNAILYENFIENGMNINQFCA